MTIPVMMTVAGSDCSAGAGIQADLKAAHAMGAFALTAITCVVAEAPGHVRSIQAIAQQIVSEQIAVNLEYFPVRAIKTGMLYSTEIVHCVHSLLAQIDIPLVVDPVMIATAGNSLMQQEALTLYRNLLLPAATLMTPNLDEAAVLLGTTDLLTYDCLPQAAYALATQYHCAVLLKGGHLDTLCRDVLVAANGTLLYDWKHPKLIGVGTHGTGCSLSAAITARLACGDTLTQAVETGLHFIEQTILKHEHWDKPKKVDALKLL